MEQAPPSGTSRPRRPGRPPSEAARLRVLEAAGRILAEDGLGRLTVDRVSLASGVGKPTIYRHWANAQELAMAAFMAAPQPRYAAPRSRTARAALQAHLAGVAAAFDTPRGRQLTLTMAAADPGSELYKAFRNQVILRSRSTGRELLERGVASGELRPPPDPEVALDALYGPLFYRLLSGHAPVSGDFTRRLVDLLLDGLGVR